MNIKPVHSLKGICGKEPSKKASSKSIKPLLSPSDKVKESQSRFKDGQGMKLCKESQKKWQQVKTPPVLKRQSTQDSRQDRNQAKNSSYEHQAQKENRPQDSKIHYLKQSHKIHSDQESTNPYRYNKQSPDQQKDPYKISSLNPSKDKSIIPSRDLSITLMCNSQHKPQIYSPKFTERHKASKNQSPSLHDLKAKITRKIHSFKSLTKLHELESEYYVKKVGISNEEQKRLQKIQYIEINSAIKEISQLKGKIQKEQKK